MLGYAGLREVMNDGIKDCPKEFDKNVVFRARSGKILPVFSVVLAIDVPSKPKTSVLAFYYLLYPNLVKALFRLA